MPAIGCVLKKIPVGFSNFALEELNSTASSLNRGGAQRIRQGCPESLFLFKLPHSVANQKKCFPLNSLLFQF